MDGGIEPPQPGRQRLGRDGHRIGLPQQETHPRADVAGGELGLHREGCVLGQQVIVEVADQRNAPQPCVAHQPLHIGQGRIERAAALGDDGVDPPARQPPAGGDLDLSGKARVAPGVQQANRGAGIGRAIGRRFGQQVQPQHLGRVSRYREGRWRSRLSPTPHPAAVPRRVPADGPLPPPPRAIAAGTAAPHPRPAAWRRRPRRLDRRCR